MGEILSSNELDALLNGVDDAVEDGNSLSGQEFEHYDITSGMNRVQKWLHEIDVVNERIKTNLDVRLLGLLHKRVEITRRPIRIQKFGEYSEALPVPTSINVFTLTGMMGHSSIVLDANLVYALVNVFFGGGSRTSEVEGREFTQIEQRVLRLIIKTIISALEASWHELASIDFLPVENETNPAHVSSYSETDVLLVSPFNVEFTGGEGEVNLLFPCTVFDTIFRRSKTKSRHESISLKEKMKARSMQYLVNVSGELRGASMSIGEVFQLKAGDIIPMSSPEQVEVKVNGISKYRARMGEVRGRVGLKILSLPNQRAIPHE